MKEPIGVDYARHTESMGALVLDWAKTTGRTTVITIVSHAFTWTSGDALWDVGVPQVSQRGEVNAAAKYQADVRKKQRVGV
ncbi:MAG: hypothetical protein WCE69_01145 [Aestuariivirga sp.]